MMGGSQWETDYREAEREADLMAGDNPGLTVKIVEGWGSLARYEDGRDADHLMVVWADDDEDFIRLVNEYAFDAYEVQYDATKRQGA
jgi:hypothetical protein